MLLPDHPDHPDHPEQQPDPGHQEAGVRDLPPFTRCGVDGATEFSAQWWRWVLDGPADGRRPSTDDRPAGPTDAPDDPASWATGPHIP